MLNIIKQFLKDEEGATAIEYGLIAGLIAVAIIASVGDIGEKLKAYFEYIAGELKAPPAASGAGGGGTT